MINEIFKSKRIIGFIFLVLMIAIAIYSYLRPYYTYDLVPYTASTLSLEQNNPEKIQSETYNSIKETVPWDVYAMFTKGDFGKTMLTDSKSFNQQLNYYKDKPFYIYLIFILHKLGVNIVRAINLISIVSFVGISTLLFMTVQKMRSSIVGTLALIALLLSQPLMLMAARNTPDTLSAFVVTLSIYLLINNKNKLIPGLLLMLSIGIRPDNAILCGIFLLYFGLFASKQYRLRFSQFIGLLASSVILYFVIGKIYHSYGWSMQFTISFLHFVLYPANETVHVSIQQYFHVLIKNGLTVLTTHLLYFITIGLVGLMLAKKSILTPIYQHIIILTIGIMTIFFLLFPSTEVDRYFTTEYMLLIMSTLSIVGNKAIVKKLDDKVINENKAVS